MASKIVVGISTTFDSAGAAAAKVAIGAVGNEASKADKSLLAYAQATAKLQSSQGNATGAASTLSSALSQVDRSTKQAISAETQLVSVNNALAKSAASAAGGFQVLPRTIAGLSGEAAAAAQSVTSLVGSVTAVSGAVMAFKGVYDIAQLGAQAQLVNTRFQSLATSAGTTGDALMKALRAGSGGEISDLNLQLAANKAQLLGVASSAEQFGTLMSIAKDRAQQMGITTTQAFDDLTTGLGRGSKLILDNLGIIVDADAANQAYAASIGTTVSALTDQERKQALINQVLKDGQATIAATGGAVESTAGQIAQGQAAFDNLKASIGGVAAIKLGPLAEDVGKVVNALAGAGDIGAAFGNVADLGAKFNPVVNTVQALTQAVDQAGASLGQLAGIEVRDGFSPLRDSISAWLNLLGLAPAAEGAVAAAATSAADTMESARAREAAATIAAADTMEAYRAIEVEAHQQAAVAAAQDALEQNRLASAHLLVTGAAAGAAAAEQAHTQALFDQIAKTQQSAIETQKLAEMQTAIANLGGAVATGLMTAGNAAEQLGAQYNIATSAAMGLINAQVALGQAKMNAAALSDQRAGERAPGTSGAAEATAKEDARLKMVYAKLVTTTKVGGAARASAVGAAATKLENIEGKTGDKIAAIVEATQQKITAIAEREAAKQAAALSKLNATLATSSADRRASTEADDLDLIGVTDEKEAARLNDREKAQAAARKREAQAADEARAQAAAGDAELAQTQYDIREKQISDQQSLDESYYAKQRELAADPAAQEALKQQYDEATRANEEAAQLRISLAQAEAAQKAQAVEAEKAAVVASAEDQANKVISAAERSAAGVKNATASASAQAQASLRAIGDAVTAIPASKTITITVNQQGNVGAASTGSGSAPSARAAGGDTNTGRVTLVGERGPELVVFDSPGRVYPADKTKLMLQGGAIPAMADGGTIDAGDGYTTPVAGGAPAPAPSKGGKGNGKKSAAPTQVDPKKALDEMKNTIQLLMDMAKLKEQIAALAGVPAFDIPMVQALVQRAQEFTAYVQQHLIVVTKEQGEALGRYIGAAQDAVSLIGDMASLKKDIAELKNIPAFDKATVFALIDRAQEFTTAVQQHLIPLTEFERDQIGRYASAVGDVVSMLKDTADLKKELAEPAPPINTSYIWQLVADAAMVTSITRNQLLVTTEDQADALSLYASVVGDTVSILNDVLDLGKNLADGTSAPISDALVTRLADQATRVATIVGARLIPATKDQTEALDRYANMVGSSVSILKDVSDLNSQALAGYVSPSDAQLALFATDAERITLALSRAATKYSKDGLEQAKLYAESVGAVFTTVKDGLLAVDALNSGDFVLKSDVLGKFADSSVQVLDTIQVIAARAATIPMADIAALQTVTAAVASQAETMIKMAAVPWGDLGNAVQGLGRTGGAMGGTNVTLMPGAIQINALPSMDVNAVAQAAVRQLNTMINTRR
jgi:hypothetical protein